MTPISTDVSIDDVLNTLAWIISETTSKINPECIIDGLAMLLPHDSPMLPEDLYDQTMERAKVLEGLES